MIIENQNVTMTNLVNIRTQIERMKANFSADTKRLYQAQAAFCASDAIDSLDLQVTKLRNAMLFAKAGILDPFLIDTDELVDLLMKRDIGYKVDINDIDELLRKIHFSVVMEKMANTLSSY